MKLLKLAVILTLLQATLFAKEDKTTILLHHFNSPSSPTHTKLLLPWAKSLEEKSGGKIKVEIFPSMSMGGKPSELYRQVVDGSADVIWTLAGYTPGVFTRTEVFELPTVHLNSSVATNLAIKDNFKDIEEDFKNVKPLLVHVHAGNAIHTVDNKVDKVSDLKGLKLRTPSRTGAWFISEIGAEPVSMPLPDLPQALSQKAIDGGLIPFEVFPPFKLHQLTNYSIQGPNSQRFGTSVLLLLMNKKKYDNLSKELQEIIDESMNIDMVKQAGEIWMDIETPGITLQKDKKEGGIIELDAQSIKDFNAAGEAVVSKWIKEVEAKGIDGKSLVEKARKSIEANSK